MPMWSEVLTRIEVVLALIALLAAVKSAWNGWLRKKVIVPLDRLEGMSESIEEMEEKTGQMYERQEYQIDAIIALARSMNDENGEFDEGQFRDQVGRASDPEDFLRGGEK